MRGDENKLALAAVNKIRLQGRCWIHFELEKVIKSRAQGTAFGVRRAVEYSVLFVMNYTEMILYITATVCRLGVSLL